MPFGSPFDFRYVALDELGNMAPDWQNNENMSARFVSWLERMAADGYDQRVSPRGHGSPCIFHW
jgi:hypothetical protein